MSETTAPANGHEGVSAKLKSWLEDSARVQFRVLDTFAAGPIVINHRIDQFVTKQPLTWEGVGVFFVKDGKMTIHELARRDHGLHDPVHRSPPGFFLQLIERAVVRLVVELLNDASCCQS